MSEVEKKYIEDEFGKWEIIDEYSKVLIEPTQKYFDSLPKPEPETVDTVNLKVIEKIREKYSIDDEFKMINIGIMNPDAQSYIDYRAYVKECTEWGTKTKIELGLIEG